MPVFKYTPYPTQLPNVSAGDTYQRIQADANAFGAGVGQALTGLGAQFERASDRLANVALERQRLFNEVEATNKVNHFMEQADKIRFGDPDNPADTGFYGKRGEQALRAFPETRKSVEKLWQDTRGVLTNSEQQRLFDSATRSLRSSIMNEMGRHYDREFNQYQDSTYRAQITLQGNRAGQALLSGDDQAFNDAMGAGLIAVTNLVKGKGGSDDEAKAARETFASNMVEDKIKVLGTTNPLQALRVLESNKDKIGVDKYTALANGLRVRALDQEADEVLQGKWKGETRAGARGLVRGGAVDKFLDLAEQEESGGRNVEQGIVPAGGGFNPSTGTITGPSTASGYWQITDTTWRNFRGEVNGAEKYNRAIDAPKDIQRAVARQIATSSGVQHWTNFNKSLRAKAAAAGLPVSGPVSDAELERQIAEAPASGPPIPLDTIGARVLPPRDESEAPDDQVPGLKDTLDRIARTVPEGRPDLFNAAVKKARVAANAAWTDAQRARQLENQARKELNDKTENELFAAIYPEDNSPSQITATQIANDPNLTPEGKTKMLAALKGSLEAEPNAALSRATYARLYQRMILRDGDANKITTPAEIDQALITKQLTPSDHRSLRKELFEDVSPTGMRLKEAKNSFIDGFKGMIGKPNPLSGVMDADGSIKFSEFKFAVDDEIKRMRDEKKDPMLLFNPKSPEYLGTPKFVQPFVQPLDEAMKNLSKGMRGNPAYVPPAVRGAVPPPAPGSPVFTAPIPGTVPPRQPGETPEAYEKRIGR